MILVEHVASHVLELLREYGLYITFVESCTGGGLANALTNLPGSSEVLKHSFVTYSNDAKIDLGVSVQIIMAHGVYSFETAREMARVGLARAVKADVSVGVTGSLTREDPANPDSEPGTVYVSIWRGAVARDVLIQVPDELDRVDAKLYVIREIFQILLDFLPETN